MPGKTAGHIKFLPVSAKLHSLLAVIIRTWQNWKKKTAPVCLCVCCTVCMDRCVFFQILCTLLVCLVCVYLLSSSRFSADIKGSKTADRRKESDSGALLRGIILILHPDCNLQESINMCCKMKWLYHNVLLLSSQCLPCRKWKLHKNRGWLTEQLKRQLSFTFYCFSQSIFFPLNYLWFPVAYGNCDKWPISVQISKFNNFQL